MTEEPARRPVPEDADCPGPRPPNDPLRRGTQIVLAIYLLPAVALVLLVGGIAFLIETFVSSLRRVASSIASRFRS